jgi:hypothetical protein
MSTILSNLRDISIESDRTRNSEKIIKPLENTNRKATNINEIIYKQNNLKETISHNIFKATIHNQLSNVMQPQSNFKPYDSSFTPPFIKLHPLKMKLSQKESSLIHTVTPDQKKTRVLTNKDEQLYDLIYDHVLGCYYDPKTEIYYELKEK